jgi:hypothetical protein
VLVAQNRPAGAQNHRAMALDQDRKCRLGDIDGTAREQIQQLPVGQAPQRPHVEKPLDMPEGNPLLSSDHAWISCE